MADRLRFSTGIWMLLHRKPADKQTVPWRTCFWLRCHHCYTYPLTTLGCAWQRRGLYQRSGGAADATAEVASRRAELDPTVWDVLDYSSIDKPLPVSGPGFALKTWSMADACMQMPLRRGPVEEQTVIRGSP